MSEMRESIREMKTSWIQDHSTNRDVRQALYETNKSQVVAMDVEMEGKKSDRGPTRKEEKLIANRPVEESMENLIGTIMTKVESMLNARFEALEGRLLPEVSLRPKLTGRTQNQPGPVKETPTYASLVTRGGQNLKQMKKIESKEKGGKAIKTPDKTTQESALKAILNVARNPETVENNKNNKNGEWTTISRNKKKGIIIKVIITVTTKS